MFPRKSSFMFCLLLLWIPSVVSAQRKAWSYDWSTCNGCNESACFADCVCAKVDSGSLSSSLHPGFFTKVTRQSLVVSSVIFGSPASLAGIRAGDRIVTINDKRPFTFLAVGSWDQSKLTHTTPLTLERNGRQWPVTVPLVPLQTLLDQAWTVLGGKQNYTLVSGQSEPDSRRSELYGPFMLGLRWTLRNGNALIEDVLRGSPTFVAGLQVEDEILAIDKIVVKGKMDESVFLNLFPRDHRFQVTLTISRAGAEITQKLTAASMSEILRKASEGPDTVRIEVAQVAEHAIR